MQIFSRREVKLPHRDAQSPVVEVNYGFQARCTNVASQTLRSRTRIPRSCCPTAKNKLWRSTSCNHCLAHSSSVLLLLLYIGTLSTAVVARWNDSRDAIQLCWSTSYYLATTQSPSMIEPRTVRLVACLSFTTAEYCVKMSTYRGRNTTSKRGLHRGRDTWYYV